MPYITVIGYCVMCGRKRVTFADITPLCCVECHDWMLERGYPVDTMLAFAESYWKREDKRLKPGWDDAKK